MKYIIASRKTGNDSILVFISVPIYDTNGKYKGEVDIEISENKNGIATPLKVETSIHKKEI